MFINALWMQQATRPSAVQRCSTSVLTRLGQTTWETTRRPSATARVSVATWFTSRLSVSHSWRLLPPCIWMTQTRSTARWATSWMITALSRSVNHPWAFHIILSLNVIHWFLISVFCFFAPVVLSVVRFQFRYCVMLKMIQNTIKTVIHCWLLSTWMSEWMFNLHMLHNYTHDVAECSVRQVSEINVTTTLLRLRLQNVAGRIKK